MRTLRAFFATVRCVAELLELHTVRIGEDGGRDALLVDGVVQSISPADGLRTGGYWAAMVPTERPRRALILGLGGGTIARLLQARFGPEIEIVGVDNDPTVLQVARAAGWLPTHGMDVVIADAFEYVQTAPERSFDYAAIDLFRGEEFIGRALTRPFLRRVRALLEPRGHVAVNMFSDRHKHARIERIGALFEIQQQLSVGGNVVIHARRKR